jgi:flagellar hook-length control protein FliK
MNMTSTSPLNLLPPASASRPDSPPPAPQTDGSFNDALKRAQGQQADGSNDDADSASAAQASPAQSDPPSASPVGAKAGDGADKTGAAKKTQQVKASGAKKTATDDGSEADETDAEVLLNLPVEDATAKQPKKQPGKTAVKPAGPGPTAAATPVTPAVSKTPKADPAKTGSAETAATAAATAAATPVKAKADQADPDAAGPASDTDEKEVQTDGLPAGVAIKAGKGADRAGLRSAKKSPDGSDAGANAEAALTASAAVVGAFASAGPENEASAVSAVGAAGAGNDPTGGPSTAALAALLQTHDADADKTTAPAAAAPKLPPQQQFIEDNHPKIVTGVSGQLMPDGGTMQIRLDPPELGTVQVTIHMKNGVMSAAFETANDESTRLLSHSLGQLKSSLEATGVAVEKMHVQQAPKQDGKGTDRDGQSAKKQTDQQGQAKRDQQRQDLIKKMWQKLAGGDPLDLVA